MASSENMSFPKAESPHDVTKDELLDQVAKLQDQVAQLCDVVTQQENVITQLSRQLDNSSTRHVAPSTSTSLIVKPRDIPELTLADFEGMEAGGKLAMFIDRVEQVASTDETRLQVAKTRLNTQIALLVQNSQKQGECGTWIELKKFLQR